MCCTERVIQCILHKVNMCCTEDGRGGSLLARESQGAAVGRLWQAGGHLTLFVEETFGDKQTEAREKSKREITLDFCQLKLV